jgi:cell division protein FtsQ
MDGQRRIAQPLVKLLGLRPSLGVRILARSGAVLFLVSVVLTGIVRGGILDYEGSPYPKMIDDIASRVGIAAKDISVVGLTHHVPHQVFTAIGVAPGGSLFGFDANKARGQLEELDWVSSATVLRQFPNQLHISIVEREPLAIWQYNQTYSVIDREGAVMTGLAIDRLKGLPVVTGAGANLEARNLIDQLAVAPELLIRMSGAARVGMRRWTLYLDNGVRVLLPEREPAKSIAFVADLDARQKILSKNIREVDLRIPGKMILSAAETPDSDFGLTTSSTAN